MLLHLLSAWQPLAQYPVHVPVNPDARVYVVALLLAVASGFLFGAVPVRQVLHTNPYEVVKSGSLGTVGRRITVRDALLVVQIAICAVLVTSSLVAVRGLVRTLHSDFGFDPRRAMLIDVNLNMAGYAGTRLPAMERRMLDALGAIPGVQSAGLVNRPPLDEGSDGSAVYADSVTDLKPTNARADATEYSVSPEYFAAARTTFVAGRNLSWHDDQSSPHVAVVNREFAREMFGSLTHAIGGHFKMPDGTRLEVVGVVEDGKYNYLTETPQPATFLPLLQSPASEVWFVVRASRDPQQLATAVEDVLRDLDPGLPFFVETWDRKLDSALFATRMATLSLGVLGLLGAMLAITGIFGTAAYSVSKRMRELGIRVALGAQRSEVLQAALGRAFRSLAIGSVAGLLLGILASQVLASIVYQATPRDPVVMAGAVLGMVVMGLFATWIPARRALSVQPSALLRGE
jgi:predicted permease